MLIWVQRLNYTIIIKLALPISCHDYAKGVFDLCGTP